MHKNSQNELSLRNLWHAIKMSDTWIIKVLSDKRITIHKQINKHTNNDPKLSKFDENVNVQLSEAKELQTWYTEIEQFLGTSY